MIFLVSSPAGAQGLRRSRHGARSAVEGLDLLPTNPFGMPGTTGGFPTGSNSIHLSSGMLSGILPPTPNLEIGYLYQFGNEIRTGRLTIDYVLPARIRNDQVFFGEAHGEFTNFRKTLQRLFRSGDTITSLSGLNERIDLSFGGGCRKIFNKSLMLGINGFYDTSKLGGEWYGSGGFGLEMAALVPGDDLIDLNVNYYGDLFGGRYGIVNDFRKGTGNFQVEAGYSHELFEHGPDLRLKLAGYQFDTGTRVYGWNAGAEIKSRNGMFSVRAEIGNDGINGTYHTIGGFVNTAVYLGALFRGESPFAMPEPIFRSPRNLRRLLTKKVERSFFQPSAVVFGRARLCSDQITATAPLNNGEAPLQRYFGGGSWSPLATNNSPPWNLNYWAALSTPMEGARIDPSCAGTIDVRVQADSGSFPLPGVEVRVRLRDSSSGVISAYFQNGRTEVLPAMGAAGRWVIRLAQAQPASLAVPGRAWDGISVEVMHQGGGISRWIRVHANGAVVILGAR